MTARKPSKKPNRPNGAKSMVSLPQEFLPCPAYHLMLRFVVEPATACTSITGLTPANLHKAVTFQIFSVIPYSIPPNGVLAPTGSSGFRYMKLLRADLWGPTSGSCRLRLNADTSTLRYPKPTKVSESGSVTNRPHEHLLLSTPFPMVIDSTDASTTNLFDVSFVQGTAAGCDQTVVLQFDVVLFG